MALVSKIVTACFSVRQMWEAAGPIPIAAVSQGLGVDAVEWWVAWIGQWEECWRAGRRRSRPLPDTAR